MCKFWLIFLVFLVPFVLSSQMQLESGKVNMQQQSTLLTKNNNLLVYGFQVTNQLKLLYTLDYFDGNNWSQIPTIYEGSNGKDTIEFSKDESNVCFGFINDIWLCGNTSGFYRWNGKKLQKYFIDDEFASIRKYNSIALDSAGNLYVSTKVVTFFEPPFTTFYSEVYKYDGQNFELIVDTKEDNKSLGYGKIHVNKDNSKIIIELAKIDNMILLETNGDISVTTIPSPHHIIDPLRFEQRLSTVLDIYEATNGNIYFGKQANGPPDPGLSVLTEEGNWEVYTEHNNFPLNFKLFDAFNGRDSLFAECYAITEDKKGRIWVGGEGFLSYIDNNNMLTSPDIEDFLNKSTFYSRTIITEEGKEAPEVHTKFLNSADSLMVLVTELFQRDRKTEHVLGKIGGSGGRVESMVTADDGSLWISFVQLGVLRYQPSTTGVEDATIAESVSLYPQPATTNDKLINVSFGAPQSVNGISVYNISGQKMHSEQLSSLQTDRIEVKLDDKYIAGTYFVAISLNDKTIFKKFVIN